VTFTTLNLCFRRVGIAGRRKRTGESYKLILRPGGVFRFFALSSLIVVYM
jgi:hypothetical protein